MVHFFFSFRTLSFELDFVFNRRFPLSLTSLLPLLLLPTLVMNPSTLYGNVLNWDCNLHFSFNIGSCSVLIGAMASTRRF